MVRTREARRREEVRVNWTSLPHEVFAKVLEKVSEGYDVFAFAMTCKRFLEVVKRDGRINLVTDLQREKLQKNAPTYSPEWYRWALQSIDEREGKAVGSLLARVAAFQGSRAALTLLRRERVAWDERTASFAAFAGRLELLQWLRSEGCPWNDRVCNAAAFGGHLEVLKWARKEGCPWNKFTSVHAMSGGHADVIDWARANDCPGMSVLDQNDPLEFASSS
ncbi:hypothetical protein A3770_01p07140 [Chloropicon primus]|uniref:Uncharacterized protein n=1 Tax=Chloropicon primus TaxID=1764295 RepID=A0A5B8MCI2_9CHLO|nr:hypothetical protein A3770_01p07140 [Chloropicon primus]|eukprot:QDZ18196.1 hypothetical protein A3770_01p07140 [Chloropicon primus]